MLLRIADVTKRIGRQTIIGGLDLEAGRGQVIALCGGNGAGKSTILRMIAGILHPTSGTISIDGLAWAKQRRRYAAQVGYMPDDYRFGAGLTALETMTFWAKLKGLPRGRAEEALREVGLGETGRKPVSSFSKGMRQRVMLAQALLAHPPLLLMDEPTNGLDPYWLSTFGELVQRAAARGQTVFFSTHQLQLAERLAGRIVFLEGGEIRYDGSGEQIRAGLGADGAEAAFADLLFNI
ncbi:ABC transporter ATP-binding protein [Paenibacillus sabuli]|nr:ABC transporter ATP-binding protein [Paenibacillus sabuli]